MLSTERLVLGLKSLNRISEVWKCLFLSCQPIKELLAYLQFCKLKYPYLIQLRNGLKFSLNDWQDLTTAWVVLYGDEYRILAEDKVIVDLGANIGIFSLFVASRLPDVKVFSVEPFPDNYERLEHSIASNGYEASVTPLCVAAVGKTGDVFMDDSEGIAGHTRRLGDPSGLRVEGLSLLDIMERFGLKTVDFLKVDIEGAEYDLFEQTPDDILARVKRIGLEYHGKGDRHQLFRRIETAGFQMGRHPKMGACGVVEFIRKH